MARPFGTLVMLAPKKHWRKAFPCLFFPRKASSTICTPEGVGVSCDAIRPGIISIISVQKLQDTLDCFRHVSLVPQYTVCRPLKYDIMGTYTTSHP